MLVDLTNSNLNLLKKLQSLVVLADCLLISKFFTQFSKAIKKHKRLANFLKNIFSHLIEK